MDCIIYIKFELILFNVDLCWMIWTVSFNQCLRFCLFLLTDVLFKMFYFSSCLIVFNVIENSLRCCCCCVLLGWAYHFQFQFHFHFLQFHIHFHFHCHFLHFLIFITFIGAFILHSNCRFNWLNVVPSQTRITVS